MASAQWGAGGWPDQPVVLEINTWVWLSDLSSLHSRTVDLSSIPQSAWDAVLLPGVDAVWLMGVWARSPAGAVIARQEPGVRAELDAALPDLSDEDIVGSPYSVRSYTVDRRLGGDAGLAATRAALAARGLRLLVDYVPNHVARDHAWVATNPEYLVRGTPQHIADAPNDFIRIRDTIVALGRDPYFPPWTDVVQLNAFSPALRAATVQTLGTIADRADGVRCDMAMLLLNDVFASTWGEMAGDVPDTDFWAPVIAAVRDSHPDFLFVAEAYWDMEPELAAQGFDYCYDKRLYDRVINRDAAGLRLHLEADAGYQRTLVRFLENHDEPRAVTVLSGPLLRTAAVTTSLVPGALLVYEGQAEGRLERPPVQLGRRPPHEPDAELRAFYEQLFGWMRSSGVRTGAWALLDIGPAEPGRPFEDLVAWSWEYDAGRCVVVVNLGRRRCTGRVRLPWQDFPAGDLVVSEALTPDTYTHDAADVVRAGLYVAVDEGRFHILSVAAPLGHAGHG